jgi:hypothetical protein
MIFSSSSLCPPCTLWLMSYECTTEYTEGTEKRGRAAERE